MNDAKSSPRGTRPGGRSARIRESVLETTLRILEDQPIPETSVKEIAAQAGVAETTIYRRWGSLSALISDALSAFALTENPIPDTGSLESDLTQLLRNVVTIIERPSIRRIFRFAMSVDESDEEAAEARKRFWTMRFDAGTEVVTRAIERAEILPLAEPLDVIEALVATVYVRSFLLERPITDAVIAESVRAAMRIARRTA